MSGLEADYPDVHFVYMTGHTDGSGLAGTLHIRNQQIRDYCAANAKILYDFEDIESYDPDGNYFGDRYVTDDCDYDGGSRNWATEWQNSHEGCRLVRVRLGAQQALERQPQGIRGLVALGPAGGRASPIHPGQPYPASLPRLRGWGVS